MWTGPLRKGVQRGRVGRRSSFIPACSELNLDHIVPRAHGGRTSWENVVCSCLPCNLSKGARTPEQAGMKLLRRPTRPRWTPFLKGPVHKTTYREWLPFLSVAELSYWNVELDTGE